MPQIENPDDHYDYHEQYYSINTGVHRKGGVKLVTPTLTNHLGFWYPPSSSTDGAQTSVVRFGHHIDKYVCALFKAMRDCRDFESNFTFTIADTEIAGLFGAAYKIADGRFELFEATDQQHHFGLKDALESDNRILFMKARWHGLVVIVRCEFRSEYATITRFATLEDDAVQHASVTGLREKLAVLLRLGQGRKCAETDVVASHIALYRDVWDILDSELFECSELFRESAVKDRCRIFADFRGIVVAGSDDQSADAISLSAADKSDRPFGDRWPADCLIPNIWPFLTVRDGLDLEHREFTASFMLDKRAVYITALGPQPLADDSPRCAPLQYLLVARPVSDWQLGALVDRLHFMGTVRLAALMEMKALREAGANLRDMEHEAEAARRAIDANDTTSAVHHYQRATELIAHKTRSGLPIFWAGLQFRVERSRYYVRRFDEFVAFLGIDPIDGYQRYHHFVKARLGGGYDYINRLGHRQERAVRSTESIYQLISLKEASETNRQIAEANRQSTIANERSAEANAESAEANEQNSMISRTIEKLQTKAEIALLAVIVPHYLVVIVNELHDRLKDGDYGIFKWDVSMIAVGVLFAGMSLATYIVERIESKQHEILKKMRKKYFFLFAFAVGIVFFIVDR